MKNAFLRWWGCGAFDVILDDVNFAFDPYLFGQNLERIEPCYDYVFISHEHFDHCHPRTLQKLCRGERFKKLFVSPGCITPALPIDEKYGDAAFDRDLPITKHVSPERVEVLYPKYLQDDGQWNRKFHGPFELDLGSLNVETIESGENQTPDLPTCGYLVTHKEKQISFLHIGDLHHPYPALRELRDKVDFFIHMKLGLTEWQGSNLTDQLVEIIELVRPKYFIPTHYRTDRIADPIPEGHWPPNVTDTCAFIESIREAIGEQTQVLPFTAGIEYELEMPDKKVIWKWNWHNSWSVPPWREG
ncbi:hypothetical protein CMK10_07665 [Candidatus Poribacteria bacterium]|jgi:L-ascorbate metabolism protein UlaG (beta-lactamase superfamily)|nr:hypothetical protein [Candidatus Poribacteria bacterium]MEC7867863.1 MBL fold metallo-hydrolase [Candidatus Poribacteria bacterium]|tara:strand:+ start:228 stop:1133 length:906 start_codon:yes stop_codon:yes gene_type:complete